MLLNRRNILAYGTGLGAAGMVSGFSTSLFAQEATADVKLYDGSQIEPFDDQPINNPAPWKDRPMGGVDAKVTVVEYLSPTCPHCGNFNLTVLPELKAKYITTGKIRFIERPFRRNVLDLAIFLVAEGAGTAYNDVLTAYFATASQWSAAENPRKAIFDIAQQFGYTEEKFEEILKDEDLFKAVEAVRTQAIDDFGVQGTPSFFINGRKLETQYSIENLSKEIDALL